MAAIASNGTGGGNWSAGASWTGGTAPGEGDTCTIASGDTITIDSTITVGDDTATAAIDVLDGGLLNWDNLGSDTLTLKGHFYIRDNGTVTFDGTTTLANVLTIKLNYSAALAANKYFCQVFDGGTLTCTGYDKTRAWDTIATNVADSQAVVETTNDNSAIWLATDELVITHTANHDAADQSEERTIDSFTAEEITVNSNFTYAHLAAYGYVANMSRNIVWTAYNTTYGSKIDVDSVTATRSTVTFSWTRFYDLNTIGYWCVLEGYSTLLINYCVIDENTGYTLLSNAGAGQTGHEWSYNVLYNGGGWLYTSNNLEFHHNMLISQALCGGGGANLLHHDNVYIHCGSKTFYPWGAITTIEYYNNVHIACDNGYGPSGTMLANGHWHDNKSYGGDDEAIQITNAVNNRFVDEIVGDATFTQPSAVMINAGYADGVTIENMTGEWTTDYSAAATATAGSKIGFSDFDASNVDFTIRPEGYIYRTKAGLSDTTVHTAGGSAARFESRSSTVALEWEFDIPTGDITDKTMMVGVWCKISNATYYAGTNQLPRLTIDYDDGTAAYVQATQTTDWQFLPLPFTPITAFGQITVTITTMTDATGSDAYVYFDDFKTLFPAETPLDTQTMDLWAKGLPIVPPIATVLSALDVWSAATSALTGTGTIGKLEVDTEKKVDDNQALIIAK